MIIRYVLTKEHLRAGAGEHYNHRMGWRRHVGTVLGPTFVLCGLWNLFSEGQPSSTTFILIALGVYFSIRRYIWIHRSVRNSAAGKTDEDRAVTATIDDEGIHMETHQGHGTLKWDAFVDRHLTNEGLLLYQAKNIYYWIPKESEIEGGDWSEFTDLIIRRVRVKI